MAVIALPTVIIDITSPEWRFEATGPWTVIRDRRGVLRMRHPYEPSSQGGFASARLTVPIFTAPIRVLLRFYHSDDYAGSDRENPEIGYPAEDFPGRRFARVLVNGAEVWCRDVHGPNPTPEQRFYEVPFSAPGGSTFEVEFRVEDRADVPQPFATEVFWALPRIELLTVGEEPGPWGADEVITPPLHTPGAAAAEPVAIRRVPLVVENTTDLPRTREAVVSGVPLPQGELLDPSRALLRDVAGAQVPCQFAPLAQWPDGSVKSLLVAFASGEVPARERACFSLEYGTDVPPAAATDAIAVQGEDGSIAVDTGALWARLSAASGAVIDSLALPGRDPLVFTEALLSLENYEGFPPRLYRSLPPETLELERNGPLCACVLASGRYEALSEEGFSYELRLRFFRDSAQIKLTHTLINTAETPRTRLRTISVHLPAQASAFSLGEAEGYHGGLQGLREVRLIQDHHDRHRVYHLRGEGPAPLSAEDVGLVARGERSDGRAALTGERFSLQVANHNFREQYPKALRLRPDGLQIDLYTCERVPHLLGSDPPFDCQQGEAKTHELLLHLSAATDLDEVLVQAGRLSVGANRPLFAAATADWYCASGVFGHTAAPSPADFPSYEAALGVKPVERLGHGGGDWWERMVEDGQEDPESYMLYGMEHFGDNPLIWGYQTKYCMWANCEYDLGHALIVQFARSGDLRFLDRGEQCVLHNRDVDVIHHDTVHPEDVGGPHGHWIGHTDQRPNTGHLWSEGMVEHYLLTGDRRSLQVAREMGRYLMGVARKGWGGGSERSAGWPLIALLGIWSGTGEDEYLRAAAQIVRDAVRLQDPVRGVWSSPIYEQPAYEGGTTFMTHILCRGLMRYVMSTGDRAAARAIVRAAWWVAEEAIVEETAAGPLSFYKQTPLCARASAADPEALAYAFALSGQERLGALGRAAARMRASEWRERGVPLAQMRDLPSILKILGPEAGW